MFHAFNILYNLRNSAESNPENAVNGVSGVPDFKIFRGSMPSRPHLVEVNKQFVSPLDLTREPHFEVGVMFRKVETFLNK